MIPATFDEARCALKDFIPRAGPFYAKERNFDRGPLHRANVSLLSAAIQRRILTEKEVIQEVLKKHSFEESEKFIQEVLWRSYWKSWLELRPSVWKDYQEGLQDLSRPKNYESALRGETGIECFDEWRKELREFGYLHNHARMWFASIWIYTFGLPWQLGAKLFEDELVDFDAASNTLSWRWVAGLHTPGKHYAARAENIHTFTEGRFNPAGQLNESVVPLPFVTPESDPLLEVAEPAKPPQKNWGLLVHPEDMSLERTEFVNWSFKKIGFFIPSSRKTPAIQDLERRAFADAANRLREKFSCPVEELTGSEITVILTWAQRENLEGICLIKPWQGPLFQLSKLSIPAQYFRRAYDVPFMGKARAGFFSFKEQMKETVKQYATENEVGLEKLCQMNLKK